MNYTIESIYHDFGQYDKVVTLNFLNGSPSFEEYPDYLTGTFYYTPKERVELENSVKEGKSTPGYVKFEEVLNHVTKYQKETLIMTGMNTEDISSIFYLKQYHTENKFASDAIRKLPDPHIIEIDLNKNFDHDSFLINFTKSRISHGDLLTPGELAEFRGIVLNLEGKNFESIEEEPDGIKLSIKKHFLGSRLRHKQANPEERKELEQIIIQEFDSKLALLNKEIINAGIGKKKYSEIKQQLTHLIPQILKFDEKRLAHGKFPVWLNYERFLHILLRHVNETNPGGNFENKSRFQYLINDILYLIETVIDIVYKDIMTHFRENPNKHFKRQGELSVYFNGDYYVIDIRPDGLLMTFYRKAI